ncbi:DNA-processing protein DprA [Corynebacterium sp. TAE3-ERU12]|uniref:DNA-processing protein DprA n=1 Tax=Corynebacterium sp. TAE3-ERU12 TaxID=2849491 RepID=UPI001C495313|nr:DNA-processing protein DprA [Corynebacterium sp. TAE3-ERU12]MBV7295222.1 DNA-processing protein DprA [Corynebacterium sp. TAE3-ERU12]
MSRNDWAYLARVIEGPNAELNLMLGKYGPTETAERIRRRSGLSPTLLRATEARAELDMADDDVRAAAAEGFRLVTPDCAEWPTDAVQHFVGHGCSTAIAPYALWVRGLELSELLACSVAIVGTRASTSYGTRVATALADGLAANGVTVVSGGAVGIDAAAHRAALSCGGRTIVVAAAGPGRTYPAGHAGLFDEVVRTGAVITEYPPMVRPARHRFLTRNRLVAGLTDATVLVEAGWRSGARNTVNWAHELNRPVGAVPGPISSAASTGCHSCIKEGSATLITGVNDALALARQVGQFDEEDQMELDYAKDAVQALPRNELKVYDALHPTRAVGASDIARESGCSLGLTMHLLAALQQRGMVRRVGSQWQRSAV